MIVSHPHKAQAPTSRHIDRGHPCGSLMSPPSSLFNSSRTTLGPFPASPAFAPLLAINFSARHSRRFPKCSFVFLSPVSCSYFVGTIFWDFLEPHPSLTCLHSTCGRDFGSWNRFHSKNASPAVNPVVHLPRRTFRLRPPASRLRGTRSQCLRPPIRPQMIHSSLSGGR